MAVVALYGLHFILSIVSFVDVVGMKCPGLVLGNRAGRIIALPGTQESLEIFRQLRLSGPVFVEAINSRPVCEGIKPDCNYELALKLASVRPGDVNHFELRRSGESETFVVSVKAGPLALASLLRSEWAELVLQLIGLLYLAVGF